MCLFRCAIGLFASRWLVCNKRAICWLLVMPGFLLLSGCKSSHQSGLPASLLSYQQRLTTHYTTATSIPVDPSTITKSERNAILRDLVFQIDQNYFAFEAHLQKSRANFNVATDLATLGLGSAGALASQSAANILAAISAGIAGGRTSVDKNYFNDLGTTAIIIQMRASRGQAYKVILRGMKENISGYSLKEGLIDIVKYHNGGRVIAALTQLTETASQENTSAQEAVKKFKFEDSDLRKRIREWYKITGNPARLTAFLKANQKTIPPSVPPSALQSYDPNMPTSIWILHPDTPATELQIVATEFEIKE